MDLKKICVDLQSLGVRIPIFYTGRKGGAGPSEGTVIIIEGRYVNVPTQSNYVAESPYYIKEYGNRFLLYRAGDEVGEIAFPARPYYYEYKTNKGVAFKKLALLHGSDCLASTTYQDCIYWKTDLHCRFCGIGISLSNSHTMLEKEPIELGLVAEQAVRLDGIKHVTLTAGVRKNEAQNIAHLARCVRSIKKKTDLPVHVQIIPPPEKELLDSLKESGTDTVGLHIETFDLPVLRQIAPAKAKAGIEHYMQNWQYAVSLFGKNQVSSFLIAGLGETRMSLLAGAETLCELGVFPFLLPLRPIPGTPLEHLRPPTPDEMFCLYEKLGAVLKKHGLSSKASKAGCVRCGSCSSCALFE